MKSKIVYLIRKIYQKVIGEKISEKLIILICKLSDVNLLLFSYRNIGIFDYNEIEEEFFLKKILKKYLPNEHQIMFDVGANVGDYSNTLIKYYPKSKIFSFEPNKDTFEILSKNCPSSNCYNFGFGKEVGDKILYSNQENITSAHSSVFKEVFSDLHLEKNIISQKISINTIDNFILENNIKKIDFLKIDTEGFEYDVLKGSVKLINSNLIGVIQFEFNEMNIISRVFLRDFYKLMPNYKFYRLHRTGLININEYDSSYEIFKYQNIIAINNTINK